MSREIGDLMRGARTNAALSWALIALVAVAAGTSLFRGDVLWAGFAVVVAGLAVLPPVALREPLAMLPWEVTALAALPVLGGAVTRVDMIGQIATYLAVAAVALIIAVELHVFTTVRMSDSFAVVFVVVATTAAAGVWAVVRWVTDRLLGTTFMLDPELSEHAIETALMWEFVASTAAGVVAGLVFTLYVRRYAYPTDRVPTEVPEVRS
ncbi:hypothetical protein [Halomicrobium salinisoli]|uniref:hypothetical protein n=1 Tax=Halomicrobium salinisoli TaxID=2878391 RepID=UPI001CF03566|nr:hypothetical protein [Halomicrobium salinisoli]